MHCSASVAQLRQKTLTPYAHDPVGIRCSRLLLDVSFTMYCCLSPSTGGWTSMNIPFYYCFSISVLFQCSPYFLSAGQLPTPYNLTLYHIYLFRKSSSPKWTSRARINTLRRFRKTTVPKSDPQLGTLHWLAYIKVNTHDVFSLSLFKENSSIFCGLNTTNSVISICL